MKQYVTFGQAHVHRVNGITFDADSVATFDATDAVEGRAKAFELFGPKFCMHYAGDQFRPDDMLPYFPRGLVQVDSHGQYHEATTVPVLRRR